MSSNSYLVTRIVNQKFFITPTLVVRAFLVAYALLAFSFTGFLFASEDGEFEVMFLHKDKNGVSPSVFQYKDAITPGVKLVDVSVNDKLADHVEIRFVEDKTQKVVFPCFSQAQLKSFGIKTHIYKGWVTSLEDIKKSNQCEDLAKRIPMSSIAYDDTQQKIQLTLPQEAVSYKRFQMISSKEWDDGVPSLRATYSGYIYQTEQNNQPSSANNTTTNSFFSINSVATAGAWRLYSFDAFNKGESGWENNHDRLYLERDITPLQAKVSIGDIYSYSPSSIMGTIPLRGVKFITNERMLLDSQFTYTPVIRGVAKTNARLVVRQQGNIIYSKAVTPGNFAIDDVYSGQIGSDLDVTVEESDGSVQRFTVPYTALPNMIRPDAFRYSLSIGEYRGSNGFQGKPLVGTLSVERGFDAFTLNSSALSSDEYQSFSIGSAWNGGQIGAFSIDVAQAHYDQDWDLSENEKQSKNGIAIRQLYAKQFESSDTGLRILGYQYRSEDFLDFSEFINRTGYSGGQSYEYGDSLWNKRRRSRIELNVNQGLSDVGNVYFGFSQDRYYDTSEKSTSASAGYGFLIGDANVNLAYSYNKQGSYSYDNQFSLSVSYPLSWGDDDRNFSSINYSTVRNRDNKFSHSIGYSGNIADSGLSYGSNVQKDQTGNTSESLSLGYTTSLASLNAQASHSKYSNQFSAGAAGSVVFYKGGAILSQSLSDTIGIVETPGASGVRVNGGYETDYWGRAVVSYLSPYRYNTVSVDAGDTESIELRESMKKVVPTEGASVLLNFATRVGRRAMVEIKWSQPIPVGAYVVLDGETEEAGIVGNNQVVYLTGLDARKDEMLTVKWHDSARPQQCGFTLPKLSESEMKYQAEQWHKKVIVSCR
jgi:outer membrane usher protein